MSAVRLCRMSACGPSATSGVARSAYGGNLLQNSFAAEEPTF